MKIIKPVVQMLMLLLLAGQAHGNIELPWLLNDGAVLQRDEPIPLWGTALPNSSVEVSFAGEKHQVKTDSDGNWQAIFSARKAGGPYDIRVASGAFTKTIKDVLIGDVWVCSGQSNMEWLVSDSDGAAAEVASANAPYIRHFKIPRSWAVKPADTLAGGEWLAATSANLGDFTAVGWYFAKRVQAETGVPIGLINSTWGGSRIEAWMSPAALGLSPAAAQSTLAAWVNKGEKRANRVKQMLRRWPGALVDQPTSASADWSSALLEVDDWLPLQAPGLWEKQEFAGVDGVVWYRRSFELSQADASQGLVLGLGRIDDKDTTWVNGHQVGKTNGYDEIRAYKVPAKYLQAGKNQIAVRVEDNGGGGGIYSSADLLYVEKADGSRQSLAGDWLVKADKVTVVIQDNMHHTNTALYNKMLHPLFKIPVKGVLWYQGESNADTLQDAQVYSRQFTALINDLRAGWNKPELPFYWVQLANFISGNDTPESSPWAMLRSSQAAALTLNNTGQAVTVDVGNPDDIHPTDKKTVGDRLALIAMNKTYGKEQSEFRGPVFLHAERNNDQLILHFSSVSKLAVRGNEKSVKGIEIAGDAGVFKPIEGKIRQNRVILPLQEIDSVAAIRYAWSDNPENANLMNTAGLPAEPFKANLITPF